MVSLVSVVFHVNVQDLTVQGIAVIVLGDGVAVDV